MQIEATMGKKRQPYEARTVGGWLRSAPGYPLYVHQGGPSYAWFVAKDATNTYWHVFDRLTGCVIFPHYRARTRLQAIAITLDFVAKIGGLDKCFEASQKRYKEFQDSQARPDA